VVSGVLGTVTSTFPGVATSSSGSGFSTGGTYVPTPSLGSSSSGFVNSTLGLSSFAGALVEVLAVLVMVSLVGIIIIAVVANRADPDPTGRRPQCVYFFVVSFVTITTAITGSAVAVAAILGLTAHHSVAAGHALTRLLLVSVLVTLVSAILLAIHLRRGLVLARAEPSATNPSKRVGQSYVAAVAFVSIIVILVFSILSIYLVFAIVAPGTFGSFGGRGWAIRILVESAYLAVIAAFVVWRHSSLLTPGLAVWSRSVGGSDPPGSSGVGASPTPRPLD